MQVLVRVPVLLQVPEKVQALQAPQLPLAQVAPAFPGLQPVVEAEGSQTSHPFAGFWVPGSQVWPPMVQPVTQAPVASQALPVPQTAPVASAGWVQAPLAQRSAVQGSESEAQAVPSVFKVQLCFWVTLPEVQLPAWQAGWVQVRLWVPVVSQGPAPAAGPQLPHAPQPVMAPQVVPLDTGVKALVDVAGSQVWQALAGLGSLPA